MTVGELIKIFSTPFPFDAEVDIVSATKDAMGLDNFDFHEIELVEPHKHLREDAEFETHVGLIFIEDDRCSS